MGRFYVDEYIFLNYSTVKVDGVANTKSGKIKSNWETFKKTVLAYLYLLNISEMPVYFYSLKLMIVPAYRIDLCVFNKIGVENTCTTTFTTGNNGMARFANKSSQH